MRAPMKEKDLKANAGKEQEGTHKHHKRDFFLLEEEMVHVVL